MTGYVAGFRVAAERWGKRGEVSFSVESNEYNLDRYSTPSPPTVLGWDDDLFFKLYFRFVRPTASAGS